MPQCHNSCSKSLLDHQRNSMQITQQTYKVKSSYQKKGLLVLAVISLRTLGQWNRVTPVKVYYWAE